MAAASLKGIDKGLKEYLKKHQLPEVYEVRDWAGLSVIVDRTISLLNIADWICWMNYCCRFNIYLFIILYRVVS